MIKNYQQCSRCILDTKDDPAITFNQEGVCNHCLNYDKMEKELVYKGEAGEKKLAETVEIIKKAGKGKAYDCILGVSGGVDSTYLAYKAKELGLRTLCVHFDNGWNSELAVKNIENIISKLGFDLETYVVNWPEFKDIQLAYFKANVVDIEAITDHAITGTIYRLATKYGIKYILTGNNVATEVVLPKYWIFHKADAANIKDIHDKFGTIKLKNYPFFGSKEKHLYQTVKGIKSVDLLNYMPYIKDQVKKEISEKLEWRDYGGKHYESVFTRFYQGYILPQKFGIDKRKAHYSNLICSGQMTKTEVISKMEEDIYPAELIETDKEFVLKKLGMSEEFFNDYLKQPRREHTEYKTEQSVYQNYPILKPFKPIGDFIKNHLRK
jgi:N-acetyl sugar amidotransferase